jgi:hypothetical protein
VGVTEDHSDRPPSAKLHKRIEIAVRGVVPRRPSVAKIVNPKIRDIGPAARAPERFFDPAPRARIVDALRSLVRRAVRPAKHFALAAGKIGEGDEGARVKRDGPHVAVLRLRESGPGGG